MKTSANRNRKIGFSAATTTCFALAGAAAFTCFSVPEPPLTFAYSTFNLKEKVFDLYRHARPAATASLSRVKLKAIIFNGEHSSAVLNGESLHAGDRLNGVQLTEITPRSVTEEINGKKKVIALPD